MLKIKNSVNLKELEKFGFEDRYDYYEKYINKDVSLVVSSDDRLIFNDYYPYHSSVSNITPYIQDLIKADLIEKVEE